MTSDADQPGNDADARKTAMLIFRDEGVDWAAEGRSKALFQKLVEWATDLKRRGVYAGVEALDGKGKTVRRKGAGLVIEGPFAEGREAVLGYFLVRVNNLDEACALAAESPHAEIGGSTEVRMLGTFPKPYSQRSEPFLEEVLLGAPCRRAPRGLGDTPREPLGHRRVGPRARQSRPASTGSSSSTVVTDEHFERPQAGRVPLLVRSRSPVAAGLQARRQLEKLVVQRDDCVQWSPHNSRRRAVRAWAIPASR